MVLAQFGVSTTLEEVLEFFTTHTLLQNVGLQDGAKLLGLDDQRVDFRAVQLNSYYASVISDFIRHRLLDQNVSFTFETVMSSGRNSGLVYG